MDNERARKNEAVILQALASVGQCTVALDLGVSEATVSRLKDGDFQKLSKVLAICKLKVIPQEMKCYKPESIQAILTLAQERMSEIETPEQLSWK